MDQQDPRRFFNPAERAALLAAADGHCTICGGELDLTHGWHADHITPHTAGGPTNIDNGQALCPTCNLTKGATLPDPLPDLPDPAHGTPAPEAAVTFPSPIAPEAHMNGSIRYDRPSLRCSAHRTDGAPCAAYAMHGTTVCAAHGGRAPQVRAAAQRRLEVEKAQRQVRRLGLNEAPAMHPVEALERSIAATAAMCAYLRDLVSDVADSGSDSKALLFVWQAALREWEVALGRICTSALRAGVEERRVRIAERDGALMVKALTGALVDLGFDPGDDRVRKTLARHLEAAGEVARAVNGER